MSSVKAAVGVIKHCKLQTKEQFEEIFKLNWKGKGSCREAYQIGNLPLIVKFEFDDSTNRHTNKEIAAQAILRTSKMKRYVPPFYYTAPGVIVMPLYKRRDTQSHEKLAKMETKLAAKIREAGFQPFDLHWGNVMEDARGVAKITDMGMFMRYVL